MTISIKIKDWINRNLFFISACVIFMMYMRRFDAISSFTVLDDEFGYWGIAAYFAGYNWSDIISRIPYYSYGYSLLLTPFYWIFDDPTNMYKAAIVMNSVLLTASFALCYDMSKRLINSSNRPLILGLSMIIAFYPSYLVYSNIALTECLLIFLCWLLAWCFTGLNCESSIYRFILIGFVSSYAYMIHQRTIGILFASIIVVFLMRLFKGIRVKQLIATVVPIALMMIIHFYLKNYIQNNLWLNSAGNLTNDYSSQIEKLIYLFTIDGIIMGFKVLFGHLYYLGVSTYLVFFIGIHGIYSRIVEMIKKSLIMKEIDTIDCDFFLNLFLLISFISTLAISVVFFINPIRMDQIVYGRYVDILIGPILLQGLASMMNHRSIQKKRNLVITALFFFIVVVTGFTTSDFLANSFCRHNCVGLVFMTTSFGVYLPALLGLLGFRLLNLSFANRGKLMIVTILVITGSFFITSETVLNLLVIPKQIESDMIMIADIITNNEEDLPVYFLWDKPITNTYNNWDSLNGLNRYYAEYYQFLLYEENLVLVNEDDLLHLGEDKYVIVTEAENTRYIELNSKYCMDAGSSELYIFE